MPEKSIREMNDFERLQNSLSARTFHAIIIICVVLSLAAVLFGFYLYTNSVRNQYTEKAEDAAKTIAGIVDGDEVGKYVDAVTETYLGLSEDVRQKPDSDEYAKAFESIADERFYEITELLKKIADANGLSTAYIGFLDPTGKKFIIVLNSDPSGDFKGSGHAVDVDKNVLTEISKNLSVIPALISKNDNGYFSLGNAPVYDSHKNVAGYAVTGISMQTVADMSRSFLIQYVIVLAVVTILMAVLMTLHLKRKLVKPVNQIADAAQNYVKDKRAGIISTDHFSKLNIKTGDEIENLALIMADMERDISEIENNLTSVTAEKERIGTELSLATRIQADMLPNIYPAFPDRSEFDIYATMTPAKEVGGDFYDFFLVDHDTLGIVMADVSGKGVPAALFMMVSKIMIKNHGMNGISPKTVLEKVNEQICSNNREEMFITVWYGILDLATGHLRASNAGHEYPVVMQNGNKFELLKDKHGFVIGGMSGVKYREYEIDLTPGSKLFLYTDGVPEATNEKMELYGTDRMLDALNTAVNGSPYEVLNAVQNSVDSFVNGAPQFDDLTMLCLEFKGGGKKTMKEITVDASVENIEAVTDFINAELEAIDCPMKAQTQIDIAIDELFGNIAQYAYSPGKGEATVRYELEMDPRRVIITFMDKGKKYNPLEKEDPDTSLSAEEREIGGLGVFLVKKTMDDMTYEYSDGYNILKIFKNI